MSDDWKMPLKKLLHYDPETGVFTRLYSRQSRYVGKRVGSLSHRGYRQMRIGNRQYGAARLAWLYMTGQWPKQCIDHINGIRDDDRWVNLREASVSLNNQNIRKARSNNRLGILGVRKKGKRYEAKIILNCKYFYLGMFDTAEQAHSAYVIKKREIHPGGTL
jgi:hypothetical protein